MHFKIFQTNLWHECSKFLGDLSGGHIADGSVQVSVIGGYIDERGDAAKNSLTLLKTLHDEERVLELIHFCVGSYNTAKACELLESGDSFFSILQINSCFFQAKIIDTALQRWLF